VVHVLHAFSETLGEAITLVSYTCPRSSLCLSALTQHCQVPFPPAKAVLAGIDVLLVVCLK
jgi:hypothetical protein